jgi:transposase
MASDRGIRRRCDGEQQKAQIVAECDAPGAAVAKVAIAASTLPAPGCRNIEVELRRGAVTMKVTWPSSAAADFAAWTRELLR